MKLTNEQKRKHNECQKKYYQKNKEKYQKLRKEYNFKGYYLRNKDKIIKRVTDYKRREDVKFKDKARKRARYIRMPLNQICEKCKKRFAVDKHHKDYNKPLEIMFVCHSCNKLLK